MSHRPENADHILARLALFYLRKVWRRGEPFNALIAKREERGSFGKMRASLHDNDFVSEASIDKGPRRHWAAFYEKPRDPLMREACEHAFQVQATTLGVARGQ